MTPGPDSASFIQGVALVQGVGWGVPFLIQEEEVQELCIETEKTLSTDELDRLSRACRSVESQLQKLRDDFTQGMLKEEASIVSVQLAILKDAVLLDELSREIIHGQASAERSISLTKGQMRSLFSSPFARENRTFELLEDIFIRLLSELHLRRCPEENRRQALGKQVVLVAETLWPSRATELLQQGFSAIITKQGGQMSHAALLARSKGIPFITNVNPRDWTAILRAKELYVNADQSYVVVDPVRSLLESSSKKTRPKTLSSSSAPLLSRTTTQDGHPISIFASIEETTHLTPKDLVGVDGIGLYRSEYLVQKIGLIPREEDQQEAFVRLVKLADTKNVTIRTFDFSGDKHWISFDSLGVSFQTKPRPMSELLSNPSLFFPHVRAILRAASHGKVSVLFPMISSLEEFRRCRALVDAALLSLAQTSAVQIKVQVGAMVELPSVICQLKELLHEADFICLGTNDLLQYCLAVNRLGAISSDRSLFLHEGFIRILEYVAKTCRREKKKCTVCGEMPTDFGMLMLLIGLGFSSFTLPLSLVVEMKKKVAKLNRKESQQAVKTLLSLPSQSERYQWLETWKKMYG